MEMIDSNWLRVHAEPLIALQNKPHRACSGLEEVTRLPSFVPPCLMAQSNPSRGMIGRYTNRNASCKRRSIYFTVFVIFMSHAP